MIKTTTKLVHEGDYVAEVDVQLEMTDASWAPYLTPAEAEKLDEVRLALRRQDFDVASRHARVFKLVPVAG